MKRTPLLALAGALTLSFAACSDDDDNPPTGDTSSDVVPGGTAQPPNSARVQNTNLANPDAPQNPGGSGPSGTSP